MASLLELLGYIAQPLGGPQVAPLPKAAVNVSAASPAAPKTPPIPGPFDFLTAVTGMQDSMAQNKLREAQAAQAGSLADLLKTASQPAPPMFGDGGTPGAGSMFGALAPGAMPGAAAAPAPTSGAAAIRDPRGVEPLIRAAALRYGHDPETAVRVAQSEGLGTFYGDGGKSGTAFQLYTDGGLGNEFQKETGLNPLDPENEPAAIDWAMRNLERTGWGPYHGAKKIGVGPRDGIGVGSGGLPAVPNFAGMMTSNQGPAYAPPAFGALAPPTQMVQAAPTGRSIFPPGQRFNSHGEAISEDLFRDLPGQQSGPNIPPEVIRGFARANATAPIQLAQVMPQGAAPLPQQAAPAFGSLAPGMQPFNPAYLSWAQQQDRINALLGKRNPVAVEEALKMMPGGSMSPQYKASVAAAEKGATLPLDLQFAGPLAGARAGGEFPYQSALKTQEANNALRNQLAQLGLQLTEQGEVAPIPGFIPGQAALSGARTQAERAVTEPSDIRIGQAKEGFRQVPTPEGGYRLEQIPGSPAARAEEVKAAAKQQTADIVTQDIDRALELSGMWTTGALSPLTRDVPGTPAFNLRATLDTIKANVGFDRLQQMRNASPTGGALGQVSERENLLLQSTLGNLEQSQSPGQFEQNLRRLRGIYLDAVHGSKAQLDAAVREGKITPAERDAALAARKSGTDELPAGAQQIGTYKGKPVYQMPDGSRKVMQ